jgi:hypothetical protein
MIVDVDERAFADADLIYNQIDAETAEFWFVDRPERVRVQLVGGQLRFMHARSAGQRDVLVALGRLVP